jgi:hypothetical protein
MIASSLAWAGGDRGECEAGLASVKTISDLGLNYQNDASLDRFVADGTKSNPCLISHLDDRRLRPNPFDSKLTSLVTNSEVALAILARVNSFHSSECFPENLGRKRKLSYFDWHAWFMRKRNVDALKKKCERILATHSFVTVPYNPPQPDFPSSQCITELKAARSSGALRARFEKMSEEDYACVLAAVASPERVPTPVNVSKLNFVPVGDLAVVALLDSSHAALVIACDGEASADGSLSATLEDRLRLHERRLRFQNCLLSQREREKGR